MKQEENFAPIVVRISTIIDTTQEGFFVISILTTDQNIQIPILNEADEAYYSSSHPYDTEALGQD